MGKHIRFRGNKHLATVSSYWRGNPMVRGRFLNRQHHFRPDMGNVLKWRLSFNPQRKEKKMVKRSPKVYYLRLLDAVMGDSSIWSGYNSFFFQLASKRITFDLVFGNILLVKRQSEFPANPDIFTEIDYPLISHDHFDHLDKQSIIRLLNNNPQMKLFCGLGTRELIKSWFPEMRVIEAGWYQQLEDERLKIILLPAQHWSKRSVRNGGQRLWGAFMLQGSDVSLYYNGDVGYSTHFREIPDLFGAPDYTLLGIGTHKPRWFMRPNHISPYESLTAFKGIHTGIIIPMHCGTFNLPDESLHDPPKVLAAEARKRKIRMEIPCLGKIVKLSKRK